MRIAVLITVLLWSTASAYDSDLFERFFGTKPKSGSGVKVGGSAKTYTSVSSSTTGPGKVSAETQVIQESSQVAITTSTTSSRSSSRSSPESEGPREKRGKKKEKKGEKKGKKKGKKSKSPSPQGEDAKKRLAAKGIVGEQYEEPEKTDVPETAEAGAGAGEEEQETEEPEEVFRSFDFDTLKSRFFEDDDF